ncbi:probable calcium-binding protein CML48 [Sorghum bicolor]|uniref:EF-hand domain-containing protein n=1 Tax=Sorghum bicolor TaxID=4558 RepID=C5YN75_SORBI|nr:probable calcium-binding protein CML48 [Sorghum bicolor]EES14088.1 hypothetical protein SORBI_3007G169200 [Sorghum bicolor]|eukprot:XP_002444593.1 probable calcium-binding protein CML48 [Sorghum bicolor]
MADYNRYGHSYSYGGGGGYGQGPPPSAPPAPHMPTTTTTTSAAPPSSSSSFSYGGYPPPPAAAYPPPPAQAAASGFGSGYGYGSGFVPVAFPPGTHPEVERAFRSADRDCSGAIDERELQGALSSAYHRFSIRTVRLLMFLFNDASSSSSTPSRMGPTQFVSLWNCLGQWRGIFDRYDRDRSGKIDSRELTEALRSLGYAVPPSVIELLIANYNNGVPSNGALDFDNFVECGMIVKGLTEKFKEKDTRYTGSATLTYDGFLSMVIPFIVP